ncbi:MAG: RNA polymerase sigma-I factor [Bacillota bacterium]|jgi:RNA polymerase sigma factor
MLPSNELDNLARLAAGGNVGARERLMEACKPFVFRVTSRVCNRTLEWGRSDELSIGFIALNEALERYRAEQGVPFLAFARLVIRSRLTDFLRKESREKGNCVYLQAEGTGEDAAAHCARAWELHLDDLANRERREEMTFYKGMLEQYRVTLEDLVKISPRHRDTRQTLMHVARELANSEILMARLTAQKRLPLDELAQLTGVGRKVLERGRKYIIAVTLIFYHSDELVYLYSYIANGRKGVIG